MRRQSSLLLLISTVAALIFGAGCSNIGTRMRERPALVASLDAETRGKIERGVVEPGFTPEMVYLALGRPTSPAGARIDETREGTWVYRDQHRNERDFVRAGHRRRVVFDPVRKSDVIITEPVDSRELPHLQEHSLHVTFRDGRVVEVMRAAL